MKVNALDLSPNYAGTLMGITNGIGALTGIAAVSREIIFLLIHKQKEKLIRFLLFLKNTAVSRWNSDSRQNIGSMANGFLYFVWLPCANKHGLHDLGHRKNSVLEQSCPYYTNREWNHRERWEKRRLKEGGKLGWKFWNSNL